MSNSSENKKLGRSESMLCGSSTPDQTPLAYIFAKQRHTLTKRQLKAVADALLSKSNAVDLGPNPLHALRYDKEAFVVDSSAPVSETEGEQDKERHVVDNCLKIAACCRNARVLTLYIGKMAHELMSAREDGIIRDRRSLTV